MHCLFQQFPFKISTNWPQASGAGRKLMAREEGQPGCFINCRRETVEKDVPPCNRRGLDLRRI